MRLKRTIIHAVPKGKWTSSSEIQVTTSSQLTNLTPEIERFITESMVAKGLKAKRQVVQDHDQSNEFPSHVMDCFDGTPDETFIAATQAIAQHLHRRQNPSSPAGILIVSEVVSGGENAVLVLKAEHSEAMQLVSSGADGTAQLNLELLSEVIVGNNTRVYKIALMKLSKSGKYIEGEMVDKQNGVDFADFFLIDFLGCKLKDEGEVLTKVFVERSMNFINNSIDDAEVRQKYSRAIQVTLESQQHELDVNEFLENHISPDDQDAFADALGDSLADMVFTKDLRGVRGGAEAMRYFFPDQGASFTVRSDALEKGEVTVTTDAEGKTHIKIDSNDTTYKFVRAVRS